MIAVPKAHFICDSSSKMGRIHVTLHTPNISFKLSPQSLSMCASKEPQRAIAWAVVALMY